MNDELIRLAPRFFPDPSTTVYVGRDNTIWIYNQFELLLGFGYENGKLSLKKKDDRSHCLFILSQEIKTEQYGWEVLVEHYSLCGMKHHF